MRRTFALALVGVAACGDGSGERADVVVRDSAGVTIVEFDDSTIALPEWVAVDSPLVAIGVVEGAPEYMLEYVGHALRLSDGRIVVAEGGSNELRFYDARGRHLTTSGRNGEGPGEFRSFWNVFRGPGDSIVVWDFALRRASVVAPDGSFARSMQIGVDGDVPATPRLAGVLPDGRLLATEWFTGGDGPPPPGQSRIQRDPVPLIVHSPTGTPIDTIGVWPGVETYMASHGTVSVRPAPFGRNTTIATVDDLILVADNDRWELLLLDATGATRRILRNTRPAEPLSDADVARYRSRADDPEASATQRRLIREAPMPETYPAFGDVIVAADSAIWLSDYRTAWEEGPVDWLVVDPAGPVARAVAPASLDAVFAIGDDWLLGLRTDELDVPQVVLLPIRKPTE